MDFSDYKGIYVVGALFDGHIRKFIGEFTGEARALADKSGEEVSVVLLGSDLKDDPQSLIALGADHVYVMDDPLLVHYDGQAYQKVLVKFFRKRNRAQSFSAQHRKDAIWHRALPLILSAA